MIMALLEDGELGVSVQQRALVLPEDANPERYRPLGKLRLTMGVLHPDCAVASADNHDGLLSRRKYAC
jgi:hypothetical protein